MKIEIGQDGQFVKASSSTATVSVVEGDDGGVRVNIQLGTEGKVKSVVTEKDGMTVIMVRK
jgi:hypothetical protein